jgi:hypothetical protein
LGWVGLIAKLLVVNGMNSNDKQLAEPTILFNGLVGKTAPYVGRRMIAPGELESHAFRLPPELSGSALLDLNSRALLAIAALEIPNVPAKPDVAPFGPESIKDHHLNELAAMGIVENPMRVKLFDQHSVQTFSMLHEIPLKLSIPSS